MSNKLRKIITLILVFVMLFSVGAVVASAASDSAPELADEIVADGKGEGAAVSGSTGLDTGWCEVTYDTENNVITVVLDPEKSELLGANKAQITEIVNTLAEAIKEVALDDVLADFGGIEILEEGGLTVDNVWEKALDAYLVKHYPTEATENDRKMAFIKEALDSATGDAVVGEFADFVCSLVKAAVLMKPEMREILPDAADINQFVEDALNTILDSTISGYIDTAVRDYVKYVKGEIGATSLTDTVDGYMLTLVDQTVTKYTTNLIAPGTFTPDKLYNYLSDYIDDYIVELAEDGVSEYIQAKINGTAVEDSFVNDIIEGYVTVYMQNIVSSYVSNKLAGREPSVGSADALFKEYIDTFAKNYITNCVNAYIASKEGTGSASSSSLNSMIEAEIETFISDFVDQRFADYKSYKLGQMSVKPAFYDLIEGKVREQVIAHLVAEGAEYGVTEADIASRYDNGELDPEDYLGYVTDADIKAYAKTNLTASDYQTAFDSFDTDELITKVFNTLATQPDAENKINEILAGIDLDQIIASVDASALETIKAGIDVPSAVQEAIDSLSGAELKGYVEEMYAEIKADSAKLTDMVAEAISSYSTADIEALIGELKVMAEDKLESGEFDAIIEEYLGVDISYRDIASRMNNITATVSTKYAATLTELDGVTDLPSRLVKILELVKDVRVNDEPILVSGVNGMGFDFGAFIDMFNDLVAMIDDLDTMAPEDMKLEYKIGIETVFGDNDPASPMDSEFTLVLVLGGQQDKVNKLFGVVNEYLEIVQDPQTGMVTDINIKVPAQFAKAILKACASGRIPDSIKTKIFEKLTETPDDIYAFINDFSIDDIIELLNYIDSKADLEGIIDSKLVSRFEQLDGLSVEQIEAKIKEYESYYHKLISIFNRVYSYYKVTDVGIQLSDGISGIYNGQGEYGAEFELNHKQSLDIPQIIYEKAPNGEEITNIIDSLFYNTVIDIDLTLNVQIADIYQITYNNPDGTTTVGFLPKGADVEFFAPVDEYLGTEIIGWMDANGNEVKTIAADTVVAPIYAIVPEATVSSSDGVYSKIYDTESIVLTAEISGYANAEYQWYKDGVKIDGATEATISITDVADSGTYRCDITVMHAGVAVTKSAEQTVTIDVFVIDLSKLNIGWNSGSYVYSGSAFSVSVDQTDLPVYLVLASLTGNEYVDAGDYTAIAKLAVKDNSPNYSFKDGVDTLTLNWSIAKKQYGAQIVGFSGLNFNYKYGVTHSVSAYLKEASDIFSVSLSGQTTATDAGTYVANATVTLLDNSGNYEWIGGNITHTWYVNAQVVDLSAYSWQAYNVTDSGLLEALSGFDFVYDQIAKKIIIVGLEEDIAALLIYRNAEAADASSYVATVALDTLSANYERLINNYKFATDENLEIKLPAPKAWSIGKFNIELEDAYWAPVDEDLDITNPVYVYNEGQPFEFILKDVDEDIVDKLIYEYYLITSHSTYALINSSETLLPGAPTGVG